MKKLLLASSCAWLAFGAGNLAFATPKNAEATPTKDASSLKLSSPAWEQSADGSYYSLCNVRYCTNVVNETYQYMNIYVPAAYLKGGKCNGYTAKTAPVIIENNCMGWNSSRPGRANTTYLNEGFVFVSVGARSRKAEAGTGKIPAPVVDQKAAVRALRLNATVIPGDKEKIISLGSSGGGQMSSILGATGNMPAYLPYLYESGAAGVKKNADGSYASTLRDDIFGSMCYCPIADLDNADLAYAWMWYDSGATSMFSMFGGRGGPGGMGGPGGAGGPPPGGNARPDFSANNQKGAGGPPPGAMGAPGGGNVPTKARGRLAGGPPGGGAGGGATKFSDFQLALQKDLAVAFCAYVNRLGLTDEKGKILTFDLSADGTPDPRKGSYYDKFLKNISDSLNAWIAAGNDWKSAYAKLKSPEKWLAKNADGTWSVSDLAGFLNGTGLSRNKDIPGFDTLSASAEGNAFGKAEEGGVHFSASVAAVLKANYEKYKALDGFSEKDVDAYIEQAQRDDIRRQTYLANATQIMLAVAEGRENAVPAKFWRTRNGTADEHTSFSVAYNLCVAATRAGSKADYALVWNMRHGSQEGSSTGTFIDWVHAICGNKWRTTTMTPATPAAPDAGGPPARHGGTGGGGTGASAEKRRSRH